MSLTAAEQKRRMIDQGFAQLNNLEMADKLPPTHSVGQSPENYYAVCTDGDVCAQLKQAMPNVPAMAMSFKDVVGKPQVQSELASLINYKPEAMS